ncbi:MAG: hypothetical protein GY858_08600 [Candidatus Omnitrophica bacterium]|nr:hypothetical protein [Candidatus Omnitrophota bacterium]
MKTKYKFTFWGIIFILFGTFGFLANTLCCYFYFFEKQLPTGKMGSFLSFMCAPSTHLSLSSAWPSPWSMCTLMVATTLIFSLFIWIGLFSLKKDGSHLKADMNPELKQALENNDFEKAALLRDQAKRKQDI